MAITWTKEVVKDTKFQMSSESGWSGQRHFLVKFDEHSSGNAYVACTASGIPSGGNPFASSTSASTSGSTSDTECYLINKYAQPDSSDGMDTLYHVFCEYGYIKYSLDSDSVPPWEPDPVYNFSINEFEEVMTPSGTSGTSGYGCNSAGDPFDPQPTIKRSNWVVDVTFATKSKNVTSAVLAKMLDLNESTNSSAFVLPKLTIKKDTGRLYGMTLNEGTWRNTLGYATDYYDVNFKIEIQKRGWKLKVLNSGYNEIKDEVKQKIMILNPETGDKEPASTPQLLGSDGKAMTSGNPVFLEFDTYDSEDWSDLKTFITDRD